MTEPTTQALIELADKYAFFMPGSEEGAAARQALLDTLEAQASASKTLKQMGYTNAGGELWKPPIGKAPNFDLIDTLRDQIEAQAREIERLQVEAEQLRKGHFDASETASVLRAELAAIRAQEAVAPKGFALVPLRPTAAMQEVFNEEGWEWADVLAAAEVVTEDQYLYALKDGAEPLQDEMLETAISWFDSNGINSLEVEQLISLVGSLYIAVQDASPVVDVNAGLVGAVALPGDLVIKALLAMDAEARKRGEMFPQTLDEQKEDTKAVRNVIASLEFYTSERQCNNGWPSVKDWPALPATQQAQKGGK